MALLSSGEVKYIVQGPGVHHGSTTFVPAGSVNGQTLYAEPQVVFSNFPGQKVVQLSASSRPAGFVGGNTQLVHGLSSTGQPVTIALDTSNNQFSGGQKFHLAHRQGGAAVMQNGQAMQIRPATSVNSQSMQAVRQLPTYIQTSQGPQQVVQIQDLGNGLTAHIVGPVPQTSNVTNSIGTSNQLQNRANISSGRTFVPVQVANPGGVAVSAGQNFRIVQQPATVMRQPASTTYVAQSASFGQGTGGTLMRPPPRARVPKLATVSTYNPSTGLRVSSATPSSGVNNNTITVLQPGSVVQHRTSQPHVNATVLTTQRPGQQRPASLAAQQQLLANLRARMAAAQGASARQQTVVLNNGSSQLRQPPPPPPPPPPPQQQTQQRRSQLSGQPQSGIVSMQVGGGSKSSNASNSDSAILARLIEAQARNTTVIVPAGSAHQGIGIPQQMQSITSQQLDMSALKLALASGQQQQARQQQQQQQMFQMQQLNGVAKSGPFVQQAPRTSQTMQLSPEQQQQQQQLLLMQQQQQRSIINAAGLKTGLSNDLDEAAQNHSSMLVKSLSDPSSQLTFAALQPTEAHAEAKITTGAAAAGSKSDGVHGGGVMDVAGGSKEDLHSILACIGVELARHGITIESAVNAGWLGVLAQSDMAVLNDAYQAEELRVKEGQSDAAELYSTLPGAYLPADSDASLQMLLGDGTLDNDQFSALAYGFFGEAASGNTMLESLETGAAPVQPQVQQLQQQLGNSQHRSSTGSAVSDATVASSRWGMAAEQSVNSILTAPPTPPTGSSSGGAPAGSHGLLGNSLGNSHGPVGPLGYSHSPLGTSHGNSNSPQGNSRGNSHGPASNNIEGSTAQEIAARFANLDLGCGFF